MTMMKRLGVGLCLLTLVASAQVPVRAAEGDSGLAATVEAARSYTEAQRREIVKRNLDLGRDESAAFWKVYRDYREAMAKIADQRVKIIAEYAQQYRSMTSDVARSLLEGYLSTEEQVLKVKRQYLSKFRKGLPETKVARYYQIENKMDAQVAAELAMQIPLVLQDPR
jgi:hypothetical protein